MLHFDDDTLTDPVSELVELAEFIKRAGAAPGTAFIAVVAQAAGIEGDSPTMFDILGSINHRIANLKRLVATVKDRHVTEGVRTIVANSLRQYGHAFGGVMLGQDASHVIQNNLGDDLLAKLQTFSPIAAKYRPLKRISQDEAIRLSADLESAVKILLEDNELPHWIVNAARESLEEMMLMLQHLPFFGHAALIEKVVLTEKRIRSVRQSLVKAKGHTAEALDKLLRTLEVVVVVGHAFCLPAEIPHAAHTYQEWLTSPIIEAEERRALTYQPIERPGEHQAHESPLHDI